MDDKMIELQRKIAESKKQTEISKGQSIDRLKRISAIIERKYKKLSSLLNY